MIIFWAISFELFCRYWNPYQVEEVKMNADHKHVDSRPVETRRLIMLIPNYLTTNQSEECLWADHASYNPLHHPIFKKPFPESHQGVQVFWALTAQTPCFVPTINSALSFTTIQYEHIQIWFSNKSGLLSVIALVDSQPPRWLPIIPNPGIHILVAFILFSFFPSHNFGGSQ